MEGCLAELHYRRWLVIHAEMVYLPVPCASRHSPIQVVIGPCGVSSNNTPLRHLSSR